MFHLHPHLQTTGSPIDAITVAAERTGEGLSLRYRLTGAIDNVVWPAPTEPGRSDGLWQHSCFEAFVRTEGESRYREINIATSHRWATYALDGYRSGLRQAADAQVRTIAWAMSGSVAELAAAVDVRGMPGGWQLALSAVIEASDGSKSYWALRHPPGTPDFHHPDCFAARLPAPSRA